jgi:hypothetical protein
MVREKSFVIRFFSIFFLVGGAVTLAIPTPLPSVLADLTSVHCMLRRFNPERE